MSFTDFTLNDLESRFSILNRVEKLFSDIVPVEPSSWLLETLAKGNSMPLKTEKAKSEFILAPILNEIKDKNNDLFTVYSGEVLNADKENGLFGECDFILTRNTKTFEIKAPLLAVVEAKKHDVELGITQCSAQLVGLKKFNEKHKNPVPTVYGCVTIGTDWKFLRLENNLITIDSDIYFINNLPQILGIFQIILNSYK